MSYIKKKVQGKISDSDYASNNVPAVQAAIERLKEDKEKRLELLNVFPGILLLGDWHGKEINLAFQESVKNELVEQDYHAFTLKDIKRRYPEADDIEIRKRGVDEAACVLLIDGEGMGTVAETTAICLKGHWNRKCICFVDAGEDIERLYSKRPHLKYFKNPLVDYSSPAELKKKILFHGKTMAYKWVEEKLEENNNKDSISGTEKD